MDLDAAREFGRSNHHAVLATTRDDGSPQMSPVAVAVDTDGDFVVSTRETAVKTRNLRKRPTARLCILSDGFYGPWIQVEGRATIVSLPDAMEPLVEYYRAVAGEHPDWDEYRAAMEQERRVVVRITPTTAGPDISG
jgi:PPOX class probable F420-dependent enzyme